MSQLLTEQAQIEHGYFQARQGWHLCSNQNQEIIKLRQERHLRAGGRNMPLLTELGIFSVDGFYKYAAPTALKGCGKQKHGWP